MDTQYERVPYPATVYPQAHVNRMAAIGTLFGMQPPDLKACRVLELGSSRGLHLIAMALVHPEAQFVGIDVSESSVARATELADSLELKNVSFRAADVAHLAGREGECDYLIAHGLYSWVPQATREKIMELCSRLLAPNGIAYISFNAYPGWHLRETLSKMMAFHTRGVDEPIEKVREGLALVATIVRALGEAAVHERTLRSEGSLLMAKNPLVVYHDEFGEENQPFYFHEFIQSAQAQGLQYLAEAEFSAMQTDAIGAEAHEFLQSLADVNSREQYIDFFTLNRFRQTLLCRSTVSVERAEVSSRFAGLYIGSLLRSTALVDINSNEPASFESQLGASVTVSQPFAKAVLEELASVWPARVKFGELVERANARLETPEVDGQEFLSRMLRKMYAPGLLEVEVAPYGFATQLSERPLASKLARLQAAAGSDVTSLRHVTIDLDDPVARALLRLLDGTRGRRDLLDSLRLGGHEIESEHLEARLQRMLALSLIVS